MQNQKSKPGNSKHKSPPHLTVYYINVRGLRGNFTVLEAYAQEQPCHFALLHDDIQDSDFHLPGYLPIYRKDAGHMHSLGAYVKSNLARMIMSRTYFRSSTFYYLHIFLVSFAIFVILFCGWLCHPI